MRFNDVRFNPKRLWFCRVLAQILLDDVIVINIDESSFNFRNHRQGREWQPSRQTWATFSQIPKEQIPDLHQVAVQVDSDAESASD